MNRLAKAGEVISLANDLGLTDGADPVESILGFCRGRIDRWVTEAGGVKDIGQLEAIVINRLQMIFEEIRTDDYFDRITEIYARGKQDFVFAAMRSKFDEAGNPTYGALIRRKTAATKDPDRYVAVIDCRGNKLARRFFTRWHEVAHRLTTHADGGATEPGYRSEHDPIERLMDEIAGHVGFYGPLFEPVFAQAHRDRQLLTFATVEAVRQRGFADASFQATLNACARRLATPVIYLEAAIDHKKVVKEMIQDKLPRLFAFEPPPGDLRAVKVVANDAAHQEKFVVPTNMRVPETSVIHRLFSDEAGGDADERENLSMWEESRGKRLEARAVAVESRRVFDRVIAIVQPLEPVRPKQQRPKAKGLYEE